MDPPSKQQQSDKNANESSSDDASPSVNDDSLHNVPSEETFSDSTRSPYSDMTTSVTSQPSQTSSQTLVNGSFGSITSSLSDVTSSERFRRSTSDNNNLTSTSDVDNVKLPSKEAYIRFIQMMKYGGSYAAPSLYRFNPELEVEENVYVSLKDRPEMSELQCLAESLAHSKFLHEASLSVKDGHEYRLHNVLLFFINFFDCLRSFVAPAKPLTSFHGETFEVTVNDSPVSGYKGLLNSTYGLHHFIMDVIYFGETPHTWRLYQTIRCESKRNAFVGSGEVQFDHRPGCIKFEYDVHFEKKGSKTDCLQGELTAKSEFEGIVTNGMINLLESKHDMVLSTAQRAGENFIYAVFTKGLRAGGEYTTKIDRELNGRSSLHHRVYKPSSPDNKFLKLLREMPIRELPQSDSRKKLYARYHPIHIILAEQCYMAACEHYYQNYQVPYYFYDDLAQYYEYKKYFFKTLPVPDIDQVKYLTFSADGEPNMKPLGKDAFEYVDLEQCMGSFTSPFVHDFSFFDSDHNYSLKEMMPFEKRPRMTILQYLAESFVSAFLLDKSEDFPRNPSDVTAILLFQTLFCRFLDNLRRIAAPAKPLTSFTGETFNAAHQGIYIVLEKARNVVAISALYPAWEIAFHLELGIEISGAGTFFSHAYLPANWKVDFDFRLRFQRTLTKKLNQDVTFDCLMGDLTSYLGPMKVITQIGEHDNVVTTTLLNGRKKYQVLNESRLSDMTKLVPSTTLPSNEDRINDFRNNDSPPRNLFDTDSRFREDIKLAETDIVAAEHLYRVQCKRYLNGYDDKDYVLHFKHFDVEPLKFYKNQILKFLVHRKKS